MHCASTLGTVPKQLASPSANPGSTRSSPLRPRKLAQSTPRVSRRCSPLFTGRAVQWTAPSDIFRSSERSSRSSLGVLGKPYFNLFLGITCTDNIPSQSSPEDRIHARIRYLQDATTPIPSLQARQPRLDALVHVHPLWLLPTPHPVSHHPRMRTHDRLLTTSPQGPPENLANARAESSVWRDAPGALAGSHCSARLQNALPSTASTSISKFVHLGLRPTLLVAGARPGAGSGRRVVVVKSCWDGRFRCCLCT